MMDNRSLVVMLTLAIGLAITANNAVPRENAAVVDHLTETNRDRRGSHQFQRLASANRKSTCKPVLFGNGERGTL